MVMLVYWGCFVTFAFPFGTKRTSSEKKGDKNSGDSAGISGDIESLRETKKSLKKVKNFFKIFFGNVKKNLLSLHPLSEGRQQRQRGE